MQWDLYDVLMILAAYLIGNISPAIILGKISGVDIKKEGSGNAGTTNVLRVLGKKAALITLIVDISKGFLAVRLGMLLGYETGAICAVAVFCGHIWPCFYRFKGGKGVATAFGALLSINWMLGLAAQTSAGARTKQLRKAGSPSLRNYMATAGIRTEASKSFRIRRRSCEEAMMHT